MAAVGHCSGVVVGSMVVGCSSSQDTYLEGVVTEEGAVVAGAREVAPD